MGVLKGQGTAWFIISLIIGLFLALIAGSILMNSVDIHGGLMKENIIDWAKRPTAIGSERSLTSTVFGSSGRVGVDLRYELKNTKSGPIEISGIEIDEIKGKSLVIDLKNKRYLGTADDLHLYLQPGEKIPIMIYTYMAPESEVLPKTWQIKLKIKYINSNSGIRGTEKGLLRGAGNKLKTEINEKCDGVICPDGICNPATGSCIDKEDENKDSRYSCSFNPDTNKKYNPITDICTGECGTNSRCNPDTCICEILCSETAPNPSFLDGFKCDTNSPCPDGQGCAIENCVCTEQEVIDCKSPVDASFTKGADICIDNGYCPENTQCFKDDCECRLPCSNDGPYSFDTSGLICDDSSCFDGYVCNEQCFCEEEIEPVVKCGENDEGLEKNPPKVCSTPDNCPDGFSCDKNTCDCTETEENLECGDAQDLTCDGTCPSGSICQTDGNSCVCEKECTGQIAGSPACMGICDAGFVCTDNDFDGSCTCKPECSATQTCADGNCPWAMQCSDDLDNCACKPIECGDAPACGDGTNCPLYTKCTDGDGDGTCTCEVDMTCGIDGEGLNNGVDCSEKTNCPDGFTCNVNDCICMPPMICTDDIGADPLVCNNDCPNNIANMKFSCNQDTCVCEGVEVESQDCWDSDAPACGGECADSENYQCRSMNDGNGGVECSCQPIVNCGPKEDNICTNIENCNAYGMMCDPISCECVYPCESSNDKPVCADFCPPGLQCSVESLGEECFCEPIPCSDSPTCSECPTDLGYDLICNADCICEPVFEYCGEGSNDQSLYCSSLPCRDGSECVIDSGGVTGCGCEETLTPDSCGTTLGACEDPSICEDQGLECDLDTCECATKCWESADIAVCADWCPEGLQCQVDDSNTRCECVPILCTETTYPMCDVGVCDDIDMTCQDYNGECRCVPPGGFMCGEAENTCSEQCRNPNEECISDDNSPYGCSCYEMRYCGDADDYFCGFACPTAGEVCRSFANGGCRCVDATDDVYCSMIDPNPDYQIGDVCSTGCLDGYDCDTEDCTCKCPGTKIICEDDQCCDPIDCRSYAGDSSRDKICCKVPNVICKDDDQTCCEAGGCLTPVDQPPTSDPTDGICCPEGDVCSDGVTSICCNDPAKDCVEVLGGTFPACCNIGETACKNIDERPDGSYECCDGQCIDENGVAGFNQQTCCPNMNYEVCKGTNECCDGVCVTDPMDSEKEVCCPSSQDACTLTTDPLKTVCCAVEEVCAYPDGEWSPTGVCCSGVNPITCPTGTDGEEECCDGNCYVDKMGSDAQQKEVISCCESPQEVCKEGLYLTLEDGTHVGNIASCCDGECIQVSIVQDICCKKPDRACTYRQYEDGPGTPTEDVTVCCPAENYCDAWDGITEIGGRGCISNCVDPDINCNWGDGNKDCCDKDQTCDAQLGCVDSATRG